MSQRKVTTLQQHGGLAATRRAAKTKGVHLLKLEDDRGNVLVAGSLKRFKVLC